MVVASIAPCGKSWHAELSSIENYVTTFARVSFLAQKGYKFDVLQPASSFAWAIVAVALGVAVAQAESPPNPVSFALVLVNRVFDADGASGIEFIKELKVEENLRQVPVMLVSNHQDAQRELGNDFPRHTCIRARHSGPHHLARRVRVH